MKVYYKTAQVKGKTYYNFYLRLDNGTSLPIDIRLIKKDNKILNGHDYAILKAIAQPYEK